MHCAVYLGDLKRVRELIDFGVNMNDLNSYGETPLIVAARENRKEIFDLLIQRGAQVNCGIDIHGWTLLHWACFRGWVDEVRLILEKGGADLKAVSKETLLLRAASSGHRYIFHLLLQYGGQVNCGGDIDGWTPLHFACFRGWLDEVRIILERGGADVNAVSKDGETLIVTAASRGHRDMFHLLIQYGAQVNCGIDIDGWTPLHFACLRGWVDEVRIILERGGVDLNAATNDGNTPLNIAARSRYKDIFILLFQYGATMDMDYASISKHSFLEIIFKDVNLCTQLIVNKFHCQTLQTLYRNPDNAKKLPILRNFKLKDQQTQQITKYVESEVKTKKFCNVFNSKPIVLMLLCAQLLVTH